MYAIDFGAGDALIIWGPEGNVPKKTLNLPRIKGGKTTQTDFIQTARHLLQTADIVIESATIGASGCETQEIQELAQTSPNNIYTISCRAVKNYRMDHDIPAPETEQERKHQNAKIIYTIATEHPNRLYHWTQPSKELTRIHTSVRPMDKRGYRDERAEMYMTWLPPYDTLPPDLRDILGDGKNYSRAMVMPFAMATEEPHLEDGPIEERRRRYEKVIGLYDRGYPSFYRRATIVWMQKVAKRLAEVKRISEVDPQTRKNAWKITQRQIRHFFHLTMEWQGRR